MCVNDESALKVLNPAVCVCLCDSRGCGGGCGEWGRNERGDRSDRSLANRETRRLLLPFTPSPSPSTAQVHLTRGGCRNEANNTSTFIKLILIHILYVASLHGMH